MWGAIKSVANAIANAAVVAYNAAQKIAPKVNKVVNKVDEVSQQVNVFGEKMMQKDENPNKNLNASDKLIEFIKKHEGKPKKGVFGYFVDHVYEASVGGYNSVWDPNRDKKKGNDWTIGWGHKLTSKEVQEMKNGTSVFKDGITEEDAENLLKSDISEKGEKVVRRLVKVKLTQNEFDAVVSLVYQIGMGRFAKSTILKKLNQGDKAGAIKGFTDWKPNSHKRRESEQQIFLKDDYTFNPK